MWEKILISDRKNKKRKPTTDLITRKDTSHPAQNLKRKRRKKKGPKRFVLFSHCLHQQNYRIQRYGSLESHEKSWERGFSAQQTRWTGFFRLFLSAAASLFPRQSCLFARILTGISLYSQGNVYMHLRDDREWITHRSFLLEKFLSRYCNYSHAVSKLLIGSVRFPRTRSGATMSSGEIYSKRGRIKSRREARVKRWSSLELNARNVDDIGKKRINWKKVRVEISLQWNIWKFLSLSRLIDRPTTV